MPRKDATSVVLACLRPQKCVLLATIAAALFCSPLEAQTTQWYGTVSSSWYTAANWSAGVPTNSTNVQVGWSSSTPGRYDLFVPAPAAGDTARLNQLTILSGGVVRFNSAPAGYLIVSGSTLSLNGGLLFLGTGTIEFRSDVLITNGGDIDAGTGTLEFQGNVTANSGSLVDLVSSTVILSGSGDQTISGDLVFNDLVVRTEGSVSVNGSVTVEGSVVIEAGSTLLVEAGTDFQVNGTISGEGTYVNENPLPVQMTGLAASSVGSDVVLRWSTATEVNNAGFVVERRCLSLSGPTFDQIGFVSGAGTSTSPRSYAFSDAPPPGRYAYRVTPKDLDGTAQPAWDVEVEVMSPETVELLANYPNPFNPATMIAYRMATTGHVRLSVHDATGREVAVLVDAERPAGEHRVAWEATGHSSAVYFSRLLAVGRSWVRPLVLLK